MSKQVNPTFVGGFLVGAVVLAFGGILAFGSGNFFAKKMTCVAYFDSSVDGLDVGSPVKYRGVTLGTVGKIAGVWNQDVEDARIRSRASMHSKAPSRGQGS